MFTHYIGLKIPFTALIVASVFIKQLGENKKLRERMKDGSPWKKRRMELFIDMWKKDKNNNPKMYDTEYDAKN